MSGPISDAWFHRIKGATRDLVKACGGIVRAGEIAHASKSEVSRWQAAGDPDIIPLPAVMALEADCGLLLVTTAQAELNGRRLADPEGDSARLSCIFASFGETMRSASDLMAAGANAMADGQVTAAEAEILSRCAADLGRQLQHFQGAVADAKARPSLRVA